MILSSKQYAVTVEQLAKFEYALRHLNDHIAAGGFQHPLLTKAQLGALESQIEILRFEIAQWEAQSEEVRKLADAMDALTEEDIAQAVRDMGVKLGINSGEEKA